ncbi:MAG: ParM/StbA family protein [Lachnospiraceae bacterium]|nr:ParM/StbA family protein [Lachnospiraceae bacterium]
MSSKSCVAVDIGASGTRFATNDGVINTLPNNTYFVEKYVNTDSDITSVIDEEPLKIKPHTDEIYDSLEMIVHKVGAEPDDIFPMHSVVGVYADRVSGNNVTPIGTLHKSEQRVNYSSLILTCALSRLQGKVDEDITLVVAIPPLEADRAFDVFNKRLVGEYNVEFPNYNGGKTVTFKISKVEVYSESVMAIISALFTKDGKINKENNEMHNGIILSIDIGASTTDLALFDGVTPITKADNTYKIGGNKVRALIVTEYKRLTGKEPSKRVIEQIVTEGREVDGNKITSYSGIVNYAKSEIAKEIISKLLENGIPNTDINISEIDYVLVSGGGSMVTKYTDDDGNDIITSKPISDFIMAEFKKYNDSVIVKQHSDTPRFANINGLIIVSRQM